MLNSFHKWKNRIHTLFMKFYEYKNLHVRLMISDFLYLETTKIFPKTKKVDFFKSLIFFLKFLGCVCDRAQVTKTFVYS